MQDDALRARLRSLGIDARTWRAVALLPLVEVAWADGRVQAKERDRILSLAEASGALQGDGRLLVESWLGHPPSAGYFRRGREVLRGLQSQLEADGVHLDDILDGCTAVAKAAGGLFGVLGGVDAVERAVLADIADALPRGQDWDGMMAQLDQSDEDWQDDDPTQFFRASPDAAPAPAVADSPRRMDGPHLVFLDHEPPDAWALSNPTRLGRSSDNDLPLPMDARASRRHCQLYQSDDRWYVVDSSSVNGTRVDGERVLERQLFGGEVLVVGATRLRFTL